MTPNSVQELLALNENKSPAERMMKLINEECGRYNDGIDLLKRFSHAMMIFHQNHCDHLAEVGAPIDVVRAWHTDALNLTHAFDLIRSVEPLNCEHDGDGDCPVCD